MRSRRPGPIPEEYWGCRRTCWDAGGHTEKDGCEKYVPPCEHPVESIGYDSEGEGRQVECQDCRTPLSVRKLAEEARVGDPGLHLRGVHDPSAGGVQRTLRSRQGPVLDPGSREGLADPGAGGAPVSRKKLVKCLIMAAVCWIATMWIISLALSLG